MKKDDIATAIASNLAKENGIDRFNGVDSFAFDRNQNVDDKLATIFYNFLTGKSNQLPTFEFVDYVKSLTLNDLISVNCGVYVYRDLSIVSIDLTKDNGERRDVITSDKYSADVSKETEGYSTHRHVDTGKEPRFSEDRIKALQSFMNEYKKMDNTNKASARR